MSEQTYYDRYWHDPEAAEPVHDWSIPLRVSLAKNYVRGKTVLDLGCAHGESTALLGKHATEVTGLDIAKRAIDFARQRYAEQNLNFVCGTTQQIIDSGKRFDVVYAGDVLEHLYDVREVLEKLREHVLLPGGKLVLTVPYHSWLKVIAIVATGNFERDFDPLGQHVRFFTEGSLRKSLVFSGYCVEHISGFGRRVPLLRRGLFAVASVR